MDKQFINLTIEKLIFHEVFSLDINKNPVKPEYSDSITQLESKGLTEIEQRIIKSVGKVSASIEMDVMNIDNQSTFYRILKYLDTDDVNDFVTMSKLLADKLSKSFNKRNIPGGALIVFTGITGISGNRFVGIIKAEKHTGFSLNKSIDNKKMMEYLSELVLTPSQKLYKVCLFIENEIRSYINIDENSTSNFKVYLYDSNLNKDSETEAAFYFYNRFLGCSIKKTDKKYTEMFYNKTKEFINTSGLSAEQKIDCITALHTYLKVNNKQTIQASEFANDYLPTPEIRDKYIKHLEKNNVPMRAIIKDISSIKRKLTTRSFTFSSRVRIIAPSENFEELVQIEKNEPDKTTIIVKGEINDQQ